MERYRTSPGWPGEMTLNDTPSGAAEYCYNKNKRNKEGKVVEARWYLPTISELEYALENIMVYLMYFKTNGIGHQIPVLPEIREMMGKIPIMHGQPVSNTTRMMMKLQMKDSYTIKVPLIKKDINCALKNSVFVLPTFINRQVTHLR